MANLNVDIPNSLQKRIKHQAIDEDISVKDLVTNVLDQNILGDKLTKSEREELKHKKNITKLVGGDKK